MAGSLTYAAPTLTKVYDSFFASTLENIDPKLKKNFVQSRPLLEMMMDNYRHRDSEGSRFFQYNLEYGLNPTVRYWKGSDTFDPQVTETAIPALIEWRYLGGSVSITQTDLLENRGKSKIFSLFESRVRQCERSISLVLNTVLWGDGTLNNNNCVLGLAAIINTVNTADPAVGSIGGVSQATNSFWRPNAVINFGSFAANGVNGANDDVISRTWNNCTDQGYEEPDGIIGAQNVFEFYERSLLGTTRWLNPGHDKTGDMSFKKLQYKGKWWSWDRQAPAGRIYMLNVNDIHMKVDPAMMLTWTEPRSWPNQLAFSRICALRHTVVPYRRMFSAVLDGITA